MRKIALFVALAMVAASPAMAAPKKKPAAPAMPAWQQQNDNSYRLVRDSLPMWLPSWAQPIYHYGIKGSDRPAGTAAVKTKKAKRARS